MRRMENLSGEDISIIHCLCDKKNYTVLKLLVRLRYISKIHDADYSRIGGEKILYTKKGEKDEYYNDTLNHIIDYSIQKGYLEIILVFIHEVACNLCPNLSKVAKYSRFDILVVLQKYKEREKKIDQINKKISFIEKEKTPINEQLIIQLKYNKITRDTFKIIDDIYAFDTMVSLGKIHGLKNKNNIVFEFDKQKNMQNIEDIYAACYIFLIKSSLLKKYPCIDSTVIHSLKYQILFRRYLHIPISFTSYEKDKDDKDILIEQYLIYNKYFSHDFINNIGFPKTILPLLRLFLINNKYTKEDKCKILKKAHIEENYIHEYMRNQEVAVGTTVGALKAVIELLESYMEYIDTEPYKECLICMDERQGYYKALYPCGHRGYCNECIKKINTCPRCRLDIIKNTSYMYCIS